MFNKISGKKLEKSLFMSIKSGTKSPAIILLSSFLIVGLIFLILMKKDYLRELPTFFLPNTGNMGIPICLFAYGKLGMGIAAAISSLVVLLHFTLNIFLAKREFDLKVIIKSPSFYAIIATIIFLYYEIPLPIFVLNTVMLLAYGMIVMILMSLGAVSYTHLTLPTSR